MEAPARRSERGFTLVEVLVSLVLLAVGFLGSLLGVMAALDHNLGNALRNEAIKIAQAQAEEARNMQFITVESIPASQTVRRSFRKSLVDFTVNTTTTPFTGYGKGLIKVAITVQWTFKNRTLSYPLETMVRE